ncbi:tRNA pseudouridine(38-40) synthase TruA, partial [Peptoniphilus asaccharolyticus]
MNIALKVAYMGTNYHGFQMQPSCISVEEELTKAVGKAVMHEVKLYYSGRTDAGVHAQGQIVNFYTDTSVEVKNMARLINYHLPDDISVLSAWEVEEEFHARFSAKGKHYKYIVYNSFHRNPLYFNRAMHYNYEVDIDRMQRAVNMILGENDFKAFMGRYAVVKDTIRRIDKIEVKRVGETIEFDFYGKSFLKNMVRIIVGTTLEIGRGRLP